jgi:hypothetical protein
MFIVALACANHKILTHVFGPRLDSYVLLGIVTVLWLVSRILIDRIPWKLAFWIGVIGWFFFFSFSYYWYWFGPGAFGHSSLY